MCVVSAYLYLSEIIGLGQNYSPLYLPDHVIIVIAYKYNELKKINKMKPELLVPYILLDPSYHGYEITIFSASIFTHLLV